MSKYIEIKLNHEFLFSFLEKNAFKLMVLFPLSLLYCLKMIREYERAVIFRLGKCFRKVKGPGLFFILPCLDSYEKVDTRTVAFNVSRQEILTKDSVTVTVDAVVFFRIFDPYLAVNKIYNVQYGTKMLSASILRNILGARTLQEIVQKKEFLIRNIHGLLNVGTKEWGTVVERVEIKDVKLPVEIQKAMAVEAEATSEARALVITALGEKKASYMLKNAADSFIKNPISIQLRYLQTLSQIATENNSTIIFPIPIEFLN
ncbi:erythrocyte band 7 integral membrane -like [Brachionus plicatilis]|uniref:Erythrocyte band 7 integral membrane-like n=1 Tax=Brachionus plicatilis TaxID=10195 RepID=A0A3M7R751_BRAPC|nr:erythrocyte band 7 integral membrane -like [Brachionus plicatilis]